MQKGPGKAIIIIVESRGQAGRKHLPKKPKLLGSICLPAYKPATMAWNPPFFPKEGPGIMSPGRHRPCKVLGMFVR